MLKSFFLSASIALGAFAPTAVGAASMCSHASFYGHGDGYAWQTMANGQPMNPQALTTAHRYLPFGTRLLVSNPNNGKAVTVTVTDRGPFIAGRDLDLSYGAFSRIASPGQGVAKVCHSVI